MKFELILLFANFFATHRIFVVHANAASVDGIIGVAKLTTPSANKTVSSATTAAAATAAAAATLSIAKSKRITAAAASSRITPSTLSSTSSRSSSTRIGLIRTKIGADGVTPEQQCQCILFYLCDRDNVVELPVSSQSPQCGDLQVCCQNMQNLTDSYPVESGTQTGTTGAGAGSAVSSSNENVQTDIPSNFPAAAAAASAGPVTTASTVKVSISSSSSSSCICIAVDRCTNTPPTPTSLDSAVSGAGLLDVRLPSCSSQEICCHPNDISRSPESSGVTTTNSLLPSPGIGDSSTSSAVVSPSSPQPQQPSQPSPSDQCGVSNAPVINRIAAPDNLKHTEFGEFPWMALILTTDIDNSGKRTENVFVCGASLLSATIVLTAAHCVIQKTNLELLKVRVGDYDTRLVSQSEPLPHQDRRVARVVIHPQFNSKVLHNDLALVVTSEPFTFATNVAPICAPFLNFAAAYDSNKCVATGWGKNAFGSNVEFQTVLKKVQLSLVPREECQKQLRETRLGQHFVLDPSFICAGGQAGMDTCEGDGGGPLICALRNNPNRFMQVGIVSWGISCATQLPAVYASLENNKNWLTTQFNLLSILTTNSSPLSSSAAAATASSYT